MIRLASIGTSSIVHRFAKAARVVDGLELTCAYSRDQARAGQTAAALGMPRHTASWHDLLDDDAIDAVYIASPNLSHVAQASDAIRAGKHVLVEKSAAPTAPEWQALVDLAAEHQVVVLEEMRPAHDPGTLEIVGLVDELGTIRRISFDYTQRSARYDLVLAGETPNIFDPAQAGGSLYDLGVYAVSQLVQLFGEPDEVLAARVEIATGADGLGALLALYRATPERGGFIADVTHSKITATARASEIQGERGSVTIDRIDDPRHLTLRLLDGTVREVTVDKPDDNMTCAAQHFVDCVSGTADPAAHQQRTLGTLRTLDRARTAAVTV